MVDDLLYELEAERDTLADKRQNLVDFMHTNTYAELEAVVQGLMMVQLVAMDNYLEALRRRIELI